MNKIKKVILPVSVFVLLAVLTSVSFVNSKISKSAFGFVKPQRGEINEQLRISGKIQPENTFNLGFERAGKVSGIYVAVGDKVKKGQLLAELDVEESSISYAQAVTDREVARAQLEQAQKDKVTQQAKLESVKKSTTANKYDENAQKGVINQSQANIEAKTALLEKADEAVKNSGLQAKKTKLYAPADGIISKQVLEKGEAVSAYAQSISLIGESALEIQAYVSEIEVAKISLGDKVEVTINPGQAEKMEATVSTIDPAETNVVGVSAYKVTLTPDFPVEKLKSGMVVDLILNLGEKKNALIIPSESVFSENGKSFVLSMTGDVQVKKEVELGVADQSGRVEVLSGIGEQDEIVSFNSSK